MQQRFTNAKNEDTAAALQQSQRQVALAQAENSDIRKQLEDSNAQLQLLQQQVAAQQELGAEFDRLQALLATVSAERDAYAADLLVQQQRCAELQREVDAAEEAATALAVEATMAEVASLRQQLAEAQAAKSESVRLVAVLREQHEAAAAAAADLSQQRLREAYDALAKAEVERAELSRRQASADDTHGAAHARLRR